jgi:hypothetical protein
MRTNASRLGVGTAVLVLGIGLLAVGGSGKAVGQAPGNAILPEDAYNKLVEKSTKIIDDALSSGKLDKKTAAKARVQAVLIVAFTQHAPGNHGATRDAALKLANSLKNGQAGTAVKDLAALKTAKGGAGGAGPVQIVDKVIELEDLMSQFSLPKQGGEGIEKKLLELGTKAQRKKALDAADLNEQNMLIAYQIAVVGSVAKDHVPEKDKNKWQKFAEELSVSGVQFAETIKKKDGKAAATALNKVNKNCNDCHTDFR